MSTQTTTIGERIRDRMPPDLSQRQLAERAGMAADALSRALNGQRGFAPVEIAKVGEVLGVDVHWLITGSPDPHRFDMAARHDWDAATGTRVNPGLRDDEDVIARVMRAYREAFPDGPPTSDELPDSGSKVRELLGAEFVRGFASAVERDLGVDVVRVPHLSTDYSLRVGGRGIIMLSSTPNWFRSNWSLAHELGHLALGHHDSTANAADNERPADAFAAEVLLPEAILRSMDWTTLDRPTVARFIWNAGVSTQALRHRLMTVNLAVAGAVRDWLHEPTQRLLRSEIGALSEGAAPTHRRADPIAERQQDASARRFPTGLTATLCDRVEAGLADPQVLAWVLDVSVDEIEFPEVDEVAEAAVYDALMRSRRRGSRGDVFA